MLITICIFFVTSMFSLSIAYLSYKINKKEDEKMIDYLHFFIGVLIYSIFLTCFIEIVGILGFMLTMVFLCYILGYFLQYS